MYNLSNHILYFVYYKNPLEAFTQEHEEYLYTQCPGQLSPQHTTFL